VNYPAIKELRERALRIVDRALYSAFPRVAVRAADSFAGVIAEFHPSFRAGVTEEEKQWPEAERMATLDLLEARIKAGNSSLQLVWRLNGC
jgi:hypothetical protein